MNGRPPILKNSLKSPRQTLIDMEGSPQIRPTASPLHRRYVPKLNNHRSNGKHSQAVGTVSPTHRERIEEFNKMALQAQKSILD